MGIIAKSEVDAKKIGKALNYIRHRGPNNSTIRTFRDGKAAVGCVEMNLSPQATFAFSGDTEPLVLLDGDLYNSRNPKWKSNVNVLRELYLKYGKKCFSYLDGYFACAIIDKDEVILARDPVGVRALVYGKKNGKLYFASEAKALKDDLSRVSILPPGHLYSTKDNQLHKFKPFAPKLPSYFDPENLNSTLRAVREVLIEGVEKCIADGAMGGVALSGGFDCSIASAILVREFGLKLPQITSTIKRFPGPDLAYSRVFAKYFGLEKKHYIQEISDANIKDVLSQSVWYLESFDQDCISGWIANYFTAKKAAELTNCVFVGETSDEISGGYFGEFEDENGVCRVKAPQRKKVLQNLIDIAGDTALRRLNQGWHAASVTPRTAFPDPRFLEIFRRIPVKWKYKEDCEKKGKIPEVPEKWILRKAFDFKVRGKWYMPREIIWRKKMRFARGVGVDSLMDELVGKYVSDKAFKAMRRTPITGIVLESKKERYYYDLFIKQFPMNYENLCIRWDPFYAK